jgi:hypothetical protein
MIMTRKDLLFVTVICLVIYALWFDMAPRVGSNQPRRTERQDEFHGIAEVANEVNAEFADSWDELGLQPAEAADALTVCRRLSLALTGTVPSLEEIRRLEQISESQRVGWWLDQIYADRRYADYIAERLTRVYVGVEEGPFLVFRRRRFTSWLSDRLHANMPYDEIVRQLISETGVWTEKPAVNFLTVTSAEGKPDEIRLAGRTTRAFLGVRLDCMQCHDDNLGGEWLQSDFHQLAAFYSDAHHAITGIVDKSRAYKTQYLGQSEPVAVLPRVPFAKDLSRDGGTRRERLARWVTHPRNGAFGRAVVNRAWALLFGRPLVEPIDNIPLEGPYPPALETLAEDFVANGCNLQRLFSVIATSRVFGLSSRADHELTESHDKNWAAFPLTRLRPEQVVGGLLQAARLKTINADTHVLLRLARFEQTKDFVTRYGDTGEDEFNTHGGTIPQRLLMMNGDLVKERTKQDLIGNAATRIARLAPNDEEAIRSAYLAVLTRAPTDHELRHFAKSLDGARGNRRIRFFEDLYWILLNSAEFSWNH